MATQASIIERLKASSVGSLSIADGMPALAGDLSAPSVVFMLVARPSTWSKYLEQYPAIPPFFSHFSAELGIQRHVPLQ